MGIKYMNVVVLGSTGSIGTSSLEVIDNNLDDFSILLLTADSSHDLLYKQCKKYKPKYAYLENKRCSVILKELVKKNGLSTKVLDSQLELNEIIGSEEADIVIAGMVGVVGLRPVYVSIASGKKVLLANKESYVVAGEFLNSLAKSSGSTIFPIDSEHSAIHQCLEGSKRHNQDVSKILLIGSGGPFRETDLSRLKSVTPEEAVAHPVWSMGRKISVDSATMMNKGLELIEARWLFNTLNIEIIIHPEGIIHSLVEFKDKSVIAQLSLPDMKIPIAYGLGYPDRINSGSSSLDLTEISSLNFYKPDYDKFPCLKLATEAMASAGTSPAILNAANEVAVEAFLNKQISYLDIHKIISSVMDRMAINPVKELEQIFEADIQARELSLQTIKDI
jgi:1-deoxy-D-xylulose-5-phosphate reductoisomerase